MEKIGGIHMEKTMKFSEHVDATITKVWDVLQNPAPIVSESHAQIVVQDRLHWSQRENTEIENIFTASLDEENYQVQITSVNSKYESEGTKIILQLERDGDGTLVHVHYTVKTTALLNMLALKTLGSKLEHHASNTIMKNIKKEL